MSYIVIASYKNPSSPMSYEDALLLVKSIRADGGSAHIIKNDGLTGF